MNPVSKPASSMPSAPGPGLTRARPEGQHPVHDLTTRPLDRVRAAFIGCGDRGQGLIKDVLSIGFTDIVAVCDLRPERAQAAAALITNARGGRPAVSSGTERSWEELCAREDIDVVYVTTPWEWHAPMAAGAMEQGKHAFVEVSAAVSIDDCWRLVDTSERTRRHCVMLENCCYGENELFILNMVRQGVFGDLNHAECAYIHDMRAALFDLEHKGSWRRGYHVRLDSNLYPTHGLGPVAQYMGLGRGDQCAFLVSVSSAERGLSRWRQEHRPNQGQQDAEQYRCGDINTSIIKTELGRTIVVQHDVVSPRPYSRINTLSGTRATFLDFPARLAIDDPRAHGLESKGAHEWLSEGDLSKMRSRHAHPLWTKLEGQARNAGHDGMDFVTNYRHLDCLRQGLTPDSTVYDAASWSSLIELSAYSVAHGSMPVTFPDFTRGQWRTQQPLGIVG